MPEIGEIARAKDVGSPQGSHKVMWHPCEECGTPRWVLLRKGTPESRWCYPCGRTQGKKRGTGFREESSNWKGGYHVTVGGYVQIVVPLDDPLLPMADARGRIYEHRLVMARHLGRLLDSTEIVHHLNGDKQDNRLENLVVTTRAQHSADHHKEIEYLRGRVRELEHELAALKAKAS